MPFSLLINADIHQTALTILAEIGLAEAPDDIIELLTPHGCTVDVNQRLCIPAELVENIMAKLPKQFIIHGRSGAPDLMLGHGNAYLGSGGASPQILSHDAEGRAVYRASILADLHDAARIVDQLPHIDFFARSLVAGDMPDAASLDVNTAYACFAGTGKPVLTSAATPENAAAVIRMASIIAG